MKNSRLKGAAFLCAILLAVFASTAHAQKSGAWYWGDGDGSGSISGPDLVALYQVIANPSVNDTSIYTGYPQSRFRQDLNGDGAISGPVAPPGRVANLHNSLITQGWHLSLLSTLVVLPWPIIYVLRFKLAKKDNA